MRTFLARMRRERAQVDLVTRLDLGQKSAMLFARTTSSVRLEPCDQAHATAWRKIGRRVLRTPAGAPELGLHLETDEVIGRELVRGSAVRHSEVQPLLADRSRAATGPTVHRS